MGRLLRLASLLPDYAGIAFWGGLARHRAPVREVHQAVILGDAGVLLTLRPDLRGWELPGGGALPGEPGEEAVRREVREETGLEVAVEACVGEYHRSGFAAHRARIYRCRVVGGEERPSAETPALAWFELTELPRTLFPWYRGPLADALARLPEAVVVRENQGWRAIAAGMAIDLVMRWRGPGARWWDDRRTRPRRPRSR